MQKVLVLLADAGNSACMEVGLGILRDFHISYQVRVASAALAPDYVKELVTAFQQGGGHIVICLASPLDYLAPLVSSLTQLPVLNVLLSDTSIMVQQLPGSIPVAQLGTGATGFSQAALFSIQLLALADAELYKNVHRHRHSLAAQVIAADQQHRVISDV